MWTWDSGWCVELWISPYLLSFWWQMDKHSLRSGHGIRMDCHLMAWLPFVGVCDISTAYYTRMDVVWYWRQPIRGGLQQTNDKLYSMGLLRYPCGILMVRVGSMAFGRCTVCWPNLPLFELLCWPFSLFCFSSMGRFVLTFNAWRGVRGGIVVTVLCWASWRGHERQTFSEEP